MIFIILINIHFLIFIIIVTKIMSVNFMNPKVIDFIVIFIFSNLKIMAINFLSKSTTITEVIFIIILANF